MNSRSIDVTSKCEDDEDKDELVKIMMVMMMLLKMMMILIQEHDQGKDGKMVSSNLDYAIIGHVMNTVPIR